MTKRCISIIPLIKILLLLQLGDIITTYYVLSLGGEENNPLMKNIVESPIGIVVKLLWVLSTCLISINLYNQFKKLMLYLLVFLNVFYSFIVLNNALNIIVLLEGK